MIQVPVFLFVVNNERGNRQLVLLFVRGKKKTMWWQNTPDLSYLLCSVPVDASGSSTGCMYFLDFEVWLWYFFLSSGWQPGAGEAYWNQPSIFLLSLYVGRITWQPHASCCNPDLFHTLKHTEERLEDDVCVYIYMCVCVCVCACVHTGVRFSRPYTHRK